MALDAGYMAYVLDQIGLVLPVRGRRMFGGAGIYAGDLLFAVIGSDNRLFFKADATTRARYLAAGMERWEHGEYYKLPADALEDPDDLRSWLDDALAVARSKPGKKNSG